jgi:branched-chain amino acid transport system ATP-binding protein
MEAILSVSNLCSGYGDIAVLDRVSLDVAQGEIVSVIGANGAGKSTLLLTIAGHLKAKSGQVCFRGADLTRKPAHQSVAHGLVMVLEGSRLFPFMTVRENLELGSFSSLSRPTLRRRLDEVLEMFPILAQRQRQLAGRLSGGERQMCAIGRAMMSSPRLLMLDEPSLGLAPVMVEKMFDLIVSLVKTQRLTVLLVEQNVADALQVCQRAYVMERGSIAKCGSGVSLLNDPDVRRAYMGI